MAQILGDADSHLMYLRFAHLIKLCTINVLTVLWNKTITVYYINKPHFNRVRGRLPLFFVVARQRAVSCESIKIVIGFERIELTIVTRIGSRPSDCLNVHTLSSTRSTRVDMQKIPDIRCRT